MRQMKIRDLVAPLKQFSESLVFPFGNICVKKTRVQKNVTAR